MLFCVGSTQVSRVLRYQSSLKGDSVGAELKKDAKEEAGKIEKIFEDPKGALKEITNPK